MPIWWSTDLDGMELPPANANPVAINGRESELIIPRAERRDDFVAER
jgi:hypothetical protein